MKGNNLTVTVRGTCVDNDGELHVVDATYENMDAVFLSCFRRVNDTQISHDVVTAGGFSGIMWRKIIKEIMRMVDREGGEFLIALKGACKEYLEEAKD